MSATAQKVPRTAGQLPLGGEKYIVITVNVNERFRGLIPQDFFGPAEPEVDDERRQLEADNPQPPCFENIKAVCPMDMIVALRFAGYKACDPHSIERSGGGLLARLVMKPSSDPEAEEAPASPEARKFLQRVCYLWGHDNRDTHSDNVALNFNAPTPGAPENVPFVSEGKLTIVPA